MAGSNIPAILFFYSQHKQHKQLKQFKQFSIIIFFNEFSISRIEQISIIQCKQFGQEEGINRFYF